MTTAAPSVQSSASEWGVLARLFSRRIDNDYRGHASAIWLLIPLVAMRLVMGVNSIANTRAVASGPDAIPLATYSPAASEAVTSLFALLGLAMALVALQGVVVFVRCRAMIPMFYLLMLAGAVGTRALSLLHPIAASGPSPLGDAIGLVLPAMMLIGFGLSLATPATRNTPEGAC